MTECRRNTEQDVDLFRTENPGQLQSVMVSGCSFIHTYTFCLCAERLQFQEDLDFAPFRGF